MLLESGMMTIVVLVFDETSMDFTTLSMATIHASTLATRKRLITIYLLYLVSKTLEVDSLLSSEDFEHEIGTES